jgi:hypothetical protein
MSDLRRAIRFVRSVGIPVTLSAAEVNGFAPGIEIRAGELFVGPGATASSLLHEAGHLAILPGNVRSWATGDIDVVVERMFRWLKSVDAGGDPDAPLMRAAIQASDPEATAWAWAAGGAVGLRPTEIIRNEDYEGDGAVIRLQLSARRYVGIHGLQHAGLCSVRNYPAMSAWLQPTFTV